MPDADDPGVVSATVVERVDPNLARAAESASLESIAIPALLRTAEAAVEAAEAIRISCFGKREGREGGNDR